jgi:glutamyl-tRNA reductase
VAGFDSAILAEEQLLRQVRDAYAAALAAGDGGPILNELMRRALRFGRLVRSHARPGTDRTLADPAVTWIRARVPVRSRVAVAGTGEMGRLVARALASSGHPVTIVSSSAERGGRLLSTLSGDGHTLSVGPLEPALIRSVAALALAVRGRATALRADLLPDHDTPWVVDLSTPPAVDPAAAARLGERLLDIDRLAEVRSSVPVLDASAEARLRDRLEHEVATFVEWLEERRAADALALLRREADAVRSRHLARLRRRAGLDEAQLAAVEAASAAMLGELLHGPTVELRRGGADAAVVRRLFRLEA